MGGIAREIRNVVSTPELRTERKDLKSMATVLSVPIFEKYVPGESLKSSNAEECMAAILDKREADWPK